MHLNDAVNQPDAQGQVLINVNHPDDESDIYLSPQLARIVKPHQVICQTVSYEHIFINITEYIVYR